MNLQAAMVLAAQMLSVRNILVSAPLGLTARAGFLHSAEGALIALISLAFLGQAFKRAICMALVLVESWIVNRPIATTCPEERVCGCRVLIRALQPLLGRTRLSAPMKFPSGTGLGTISEFQSLRIGSRYVRLRIRLETCMLQVLVMHQIQL